MTMEDIRNVTFERVGRHGYQADEVDVFLKEVMDYIRQLQKDLEDSQQKMKVLAAKVEEYRNDEESIREALLGAQKLGKSVVAEANAKAEQIATKATQEAEAALSSARLEAAGLKNEAETYANDLRTRVKEETDRRIAEADRKVADIIRQNRYDIEKEESRLARMKKEVGSFKAQIIDLYRTHIELLDKLPAEEPAAPAKEESAPQPEQVSAPPEPEVQPQPESVPEPTPASAEGTQEFETGDAFKIKRSKFDNLQFGSNLPKA